VERIHRIGQFPISTRVVLQTVHVFMPLFAASLEDLPCLGVLCPIVPKHTVSNALNRLRTLMDASA
jgi:hypothetical protein